MYKHQELTDKVIKAFYSVYTVLDYGFLEKIYENAMMIELAKMNILAVAQSPIHVFYDGNLVGEYLTDILIENCVIVEIKATKKFDP